MPEFFEIVESSPQRSLQAKSDLLRILLLEKYGGTWVDCSVFPQYPLSDFYDKVVNKTGFFTYRFMPRSSYYKDRRKTCEVVSWFLCADKAKLPIIKHWKDLFVEKFKNMEEWQYFTFHETLTELYDSVEEVKLTIDNMIQIDEKIPHSAIGVAKNIKESFVYKRPNFHLLNMFFQKKINKV